MGPPSSLALAIPRGGRAATWSRPCGRLHAGERQPACQPLGRPPPMHRRSRIRAGKLGWAGALHVSLGLRTVEEPLR